MVVDLLTTSVNLALTYTVLFLLSAKNTFIFQDYPLFEFTSLRTNTQNSSEQAGGALVNRELTKCDHNVLYSMS